MYPIVFFDALRLKIRDEGTVRNKAVYLALGIRADGRKEVLGLWIEQTEGAKFWLKVFNELKNRGLDDILVTVVDGLRGFPEAIEAVYLNAQVQTCIVHLIRNSLNLASWKDRKGLAAALKPIYQAATADAAAAALESFAASDWGCKFPTVAQMWRRQWEQVIPFLAYPLEVRKIIYTTDEVDKRAVCFRLFMASVLVATERVPHLPAVALASSARTGVGKPARLARRLHAPDPGRTSDCRRRQTPCGYRDAQEACLPAVPVHGSFAQSALGDLRRRIRYA